MGILDWGGYNNDRNFKPCATCDVDGTIIGKKSFEAWKKYYEGLEVGL